MICSCISKVLAIADVYIYGVCLHFRACVYIFGRVFTFSGACLHFRVFYGRDATVSGVGRQAAKAACKSLLLYRLLNKFYL